LNILGIHDGHGASVALIVDGKVVMAIEEERLTRVKADSGFPGKAIDYLRHHFSGFLKNLEHVAVSTKHHDFSLFATKRYPLFDIRDFLIEEKRFWIPKLCKGEHVDYLEVMEDYLDFALSHYPLDKVKDRHDAREIRLMRQLFIAEQLNISPEKVIFVDHHTCHAHHAYFSSPLSGDALIFTMDGYGDGANATVHKVGDQGRLECLYRTDLCNLGRVYQYVTLLLGMKPAEHEYKVMGLAPYAKEYAVQKVLKVFEDTYHVDGLDFKIDVPIGNHYQYFKERLEGYRFDAIAGGLQRYTEKILAAWARNWLEHTGLSDIAFSGGVGMNIKACKCISEMPQVKNMFVSMGAGDESTSIGAAQYLWMQLNTNSRPEPISMPYLSAGFGKADIQDGLAHPFVQKHYRIVEDVSSLEIAQLLTQGHIVGLIMGDMEFGPRALGHRSIIADPRHLRMVRVINDAIKNRDFWMPFTPSILAERAGDYLVNPKNLASPYMTMAFDSTEKARKDLAAAMHPHDMTIRPQIVEQAYCPRYYRIIKEFERLTGVGAILNTSLNIHGKPIVWKPVDAVEEVLSHELVNLEYVVFEDVLLEKKKRA